VHGVEVWDTTWPFTQPHGKIVVYFMVAQFSFISNPAASWHLRSCEVCNILLFRYRPSPWLFWRRAWELVQATFWFS